MAIKPLIEVNRTPGLAAVKVNGVITPAIVAGRMIRLATASTVTLADGSLANVTNSCYGPAAESTSPETANPYYVTTDDYAKNGMVSAYQDGGTFEVWNDGRGAVFAADVVNAAVNALLYVDSNGMYTTTQGSADTVGYFAVGMVLSAPTAVGGVLKFKLFK